jgi:hypothetical protein
LGELIFRRQTSESGVHLTTHQVVHEVAVSTTDKEILKEIADLPDSAVVPVSVAAKHDHVSERTVRRRYPLVQLTERRYGVSVGYLRHRRKVA